MEKMVCFPLLLLFCCLYTAQLQPEADNEIIPLGNPDESQIREPGNASDNQQKCPEDIHAVLREMSSLLAEQRVEIRHLQRDNEAQAAKLRELEELKQQQQAQTAELLDLKARTNVTENQVETLKRYSEVRKVAFSASLVESDPKTFGPFNTHVNLVFEHVFTNIGNAYNPKTGFFIAPVRGAYHFELYIGGSGGSSTPAAAVLVKNGNQVCMAYHHASYFGKSSNAATLILEAGEVVYPRLWINTQVFDNVNHHTTFSGHLLFPI